MDDGVNGDLSGKVLYSSFTRFLFINRFSILGNDASFFAIDVALPAIYKKQREPSETKVGYFSRQITIYPVIHAIHRW